MESAEVINHVIIFEIGKERWTIYLSIIYLIWW